MLGFQNSKWRVQYGEQKYLEFHRIVHIQVFKVVKLKIRYIQCGITNLK